MKENNYGISYMGSKSIIAPELCNFILNRHLDKKYFIDATCGGLAIAQYAYTNSNLNIIANDINKYLIEFYNHFSIKEKRKDIYNYLLNNMSKTYFQKIDFYNQKKNKCNYLDMMLLILYSFGNRGSTFLYGKNINKQKQLLQLLLINNFSSKKEVIFKIISNKYYYNDFVNNDNNNIIFEKDFRIRYEKIEKLFNEDKTLSSILYFYFYFYNSSYKKEKYFDGKNFNFKKRLDFYNNFHLYEKEEKRGIELQQLEQLQRLERLQQLQQLQQLERLQQLQQLDFNNISSNEHFVKYTNYDLFDLLNKIPDDILKQSIIYIDPPYQDTEQYLDKVSNDFYIKLIKKVKELSKIVPIYISSYNLEGDLTKVFNVKKRQLFTKEARSNYIEENLYYNDYQNVLNKYSLF